MLKIYYMFVKEQTEKPSSKLWEFYYHLKNMTIAYQDSVKDLTYTRQGDNEIYQYLELHLKEIPDSLKNAIESMIRHVDSWCEKKHYSLISHESDLNDNTDFFNVNVTINPEYREFLVNLVNDVQKSVRYIYVPNESIPPPSDEDAPW